MFPPRWGVNGSGASDLQTQQQQTQSETNPIQLRNPACPDLRLGRCKGTRQEGSTCEGSCSGQEGSTCEGSRSGQEGSTCEGSRSGQEGSTCEGSRSGQEGSACEGGRSGQDGSACEGSRSGQEGSACEGGRSGQEGGACQEVIESPDPAVLLVKPAGFWVFLPVVNNLGTTPKNLFSRYSMLCHRSLAHR